MNSLPFSIHGVLTGFVDLEGIASIEGADLVLEFKMKHALARFLPSQPKQVRVPLAELEEAVFTRRLWLGFLHFRARRMTAFHGVPGSEGGELRVRCRRAHWDTARELASRVGMSVVTQEIKALVDSTTPLRPGEDARGRG